MDQISPGLLIAMPNLLDPNFFRSVVLLCAHSDEGAFGLVINHPLDLTLGSVCAEAEIPWKGDERALVFFGGPVEPHRGWVIHDKSGDFEGSQAVGSELGVTASQDGLIAYGKDPAGRYRMMLGYAGWGPDQLDREIAQGSWLAAPIDPRIVLDIDPESAWSEALRSMGVDPTHLVDGGSVVN